MRRVAPRLRFASLLLAGAAALSRPAAAQEAGRWDAGLFWGGYFGSRIYTSDTLQISVSKSSAYGVRVGYGVVRSFGLELTWSRAGAHLDVRNPSTAGPYATGPSIDLTTYELDGLFHFGTEPAVGYVGIGAGAMSFHPFVPNVATEADTRFVANLALGGKFFLHRHLAVRIDGRYRWRATENRTGAVVCGDAGCYSFTTNMYSSGELTAGLTYRF